MKVKITPISGTAQVIEFNVSLPCGANASIAPVSTLTATQRWAAIATEVDAAAENLLATIRKSKEYIQSQIKAKEEKVNTLLELMESDPEMKKRFDELMMNKTAK